MGSHSSLWRTSIQNSKAVKFCMNFDGSLKIYENNLKALWDVQISDPMGTNIYAMIEDYGNIAIYNGAKRQWSSSKRFKFKIF